MNAPVSFSIVRPLAIDETARARIHDYVAMAADSKRSAVIFVDEGRGAGTCEALTTELLAHGAEPKTEVAHLFRRSLEDLIAWAQTRHTDGLLEALSGPFQTAKGKALGYGKISTIRTAIFPLAGKLDFPKLNQHVGYQPT